MRTRRSIDRKFRKGSKHQPLDKYQYTTRSDGNGKMEFLHIRNPLVYHIDLPYLKIRKVKPYQAAAANGSFAPWLSDTAELGNTNSDVIYQVMGDPNLRSTLDGEFTAVKAINGALLNAQQYGDLLLLVSAAEANKTLHMVRTIFVRLYKFLLDVYNSVKHLNPKRAYEVISNAWLEYRYGWRPLYLELETLYKQFKDKDSVFAVRSTYGQVAHNDLNREITLKKAIRVNDSLVDYLHKVTVKTVTHKAGFNYVNSLDSRNADAFERLGLSLSSLLQTAHELIPFSFILDMFINVGDTLKALDFKSNVSPLNGYKTSRYVVDIESYPLDASFTGYAYNGQYRWERHLPDYESVAINAQVKRLIEAARRYERPTIYDTTPSRNRLDWFVRGRRFDMDGTIGARESNFTYDDGSLEAKYDYEKGFNIPFTLLFRRQVYSNHTGQFSRQSTVTAKYPSSFLKDEGIVAIDRLAEAQRAVNFYNNRRDAYQRYIPEYTSSGGIKQVWYSMIERGICDLDIAAKSLPDLILPSGEYITGRTVAYVKLSSDLSEVFYRVPPYEYRERTYYFNSTEPFKCSGEYINRHEHDEFDFNLVAEVDLTKSQVADLAIFGERLVTALKGKSKK